MKFHEMKVVRTATPLVAVLAAVAAPLPAAVAEPTSPPTAPLQQLLLGAGEFPAGYRIVDPGRPLPTDLKVDVARAMSTADVTPAQCKTTVSTQDVSSMVGTTDVLAVRGGAALSENIDRGVADMAELAAPTRPNPCTTVTMKFRNPEQVGAYSMTVSVTGASTAGLPAGSVAVGVRARAEVDDNGRRTTVYA